MSTQLPKSIIEALRTNNDISVNTFGYDCELYIPNNLEEVESRDIYAKPSDSTFDSSHEKVFLTFSPTIKQLQRLGIFTEDSIPIVAWFRNDPEIVIGSWFKLNVEYIPNVLDSEEFEITDVVVPGASNLIALRYYSVVPRRVK